MDKYDISLSILRDLEFPKEILYITSESNLRWRKELAKLARYFKVEQRMDVPQYEFEDDGVDFPFEGFILLELARDLLQEDKPAPLRVFGGGCFRRRTFKNDEIWVLDWVWIHPFFRNRGKLSERWDEFKQRFGEFQVEPPISPAMRQLLQKKNYQPDAIAENSHA